MKQLIATFVAAVFIVPSLTLAADPAAEQAADAKKLPNVLILGDSISIGYTNPVKSMMKGKANVQRPKANCGPTTRGLQSIDAWLGDTKWDVIHFNWGLHDLKYISAKGGLVPVKEGEIQVPIEQYEKNLRKLVQRMKKTGAKLIWCSTTPVPKGAKGRIVGYSVRYNEAAAKVMKDEGVATNDLYTFALKNQAKFQRKANVHFTKEGSQALGKQVVKAIEKAIEK